MNDLMCFVLCAGLGCVLLCVGVLILAGWGWACITGALCCFGSAGFIQRGMSGG